MLGVCKSQYVIEADGSTYPCDFYVLDAHKIGNLTEETMFEMEKNARLMNFFLDNDRDEYDFCEKCPFLRMCFSGCKRMKNSMYVNEAKSYCGYQSFLSKNLAEIEHIAMSI